MRVLHLVEPPAPAPGGLVYRACAHDAGVLGCRAAIESTPEFDHRVCLIGPGTAEERAAHLGVECLDRIAPPGGIGALAWSGLEALVRDRGRPEVVQCWSRSVVRLARLAFGDSVVCVEPPGRYPVPTARPAGRAALRRSLGLGEQEHVLLLLADPPALGDARRMILLLGLLEVGGYRCAGVVPAGARLLGRARRYIREAHLGTRLIQTDLPAWTVVPACDAAVLHSAADGAAARPAPRDAPAIALGAACAATAQGLAVVATASAGAGSLYDDDSGRRCIAPSARGPDIGSRLVPLLLDPGLAASLGDRLRRRALEMARDDLQALVAGWTAHRPRRGARAAPVRAVPGSEAAA